MSDAVKDGLAGLAIEPAKKRGRKAGPAALLVAVVLLLAGGAAVWFRTGHDDRQPVPSRGSAGTNAAAAAKATPAATNTPPAMPKPGDAVLSVSGYVIPRERIEISPRFQGTVRSISVKKGDRVRKGDVLVELEDDEYRARLTEAGGQLALAQAALTNAELNLARQTALAESRIESAWTLDNARRDRDSAAAQVQIASGQVALARTYLEWCTIRAPIDGVVLEKLVNPNELVVPMSFGGSSGPSTAFLAMADLADLQVEIDLNEADVSKVRLGQRCRISPEAYPDKVYGGRVAEMAPEASRAKGTLQVKVQIEKPDEFLTPELSAKVEFLAAGGMAEAKP